LSTNHKLAACRAVLRSYVVTSAVAFPSEFLMTVLTVRAQIAFSYQGRDVTLNSHNMITTTVANVPTMA
jgi:hypothetical protein